MRARGWRGIRDNSSKKNNTTRTRRIDRRASIGLFLWEQNRASTQDGLVEQLQRSASSSGDSARQSAGKFFLEFGFLQQEGGDDATAFAQQYVECP